MRGRYSRQAEEAGVNSGEAIAFIPQDLDYPGLS